MIKITAICWSRSLGRIRVLERLPEQIWEQLIRLAAVVEHKILKKWSLSTTWENMAKMLYSQTIKGKKTLFLQLGRNINYHSSKILNQGQIRVLSRVNLTISHPILTSIVIKTSLKLLWICKIRAPMMFKIPRNLENIPSKKYLKPWQNPIWSSTINRKTIILSSKISKIRKKELLRVLEKSPTILRFHRLCHPAQ